MKYVYAAIFCLGMLTIAQRFFAPALLGMGWMFYLVGALVFLLVAHKIKA